MWLPVEYKSVNSTDRSIRCERSSDPNAKSGYSVTLTVIKNGKSTVCTISDEDMLHLLGAVLDDIEKRW